MNSEIKKALVNLYLDWVNNYISLSKMAEDYGFTVEEMDKLLEIGRDIRFYK